jgi:hypothetical protein
MLFDPLNRTLIRPLRRGNKGEVIVLRSSGTPSVAEVVGLLPELNSFGFRSQGRLGAVQDAEHCKLRDDLLNPDAVGGLSAPTLKILNGWLSSFVPARRWKQHSYALKHVFERETRTYVTEGAFIVALLIGGFELKVAGSSALIKLQRPAR